MKWNAKLKKLNQSTIFQAQCLAEESKFWVCCSAATGCATGIPAAAKLEMLSKRWLIAFSKLTKPMNQKSWPSVETTCIYLSVWLSLMITGLMLPIFANGSKICNIWRTQHKCSITPHFECFRYCLLSILIDDWVLILPCNSSRSLGQTVRWRIRGDHCKTQRGHSTGRGCRLLDQLKWISNRQMFSWASHLDMLRKSACKEPQIHLLLLSLPSDSPSPMQLQIRMLQF